MGKRPLIWILAAYIGGILCRFYGGGFRASFSFLLAFLFFLLSFFLFQFIPKGLSQYRFFCFLPLFFWAGTWSVQRQMDLPALDTCFEDRAKAEIWGTVVSAEEKENKTTVRLKEAEVRLFSGKERVPCKGLLLTLKGKAPGIGSSIFAEGILYKLREPTNFGQFHEKLFYLSQGISYRASAEDCRVTTSRAGPITGALFSLRDRLARTCEILLGEKEAGIIKSMLLGDKSGLPADMKALYEKSNISHLLSISGLHVSLIGMGCFQLILRVGASRLLASLTSIAITFFYGIMTGFGTATKRAVFMFVLLLVARLIGRTYDMLSAACLSALLILWKEPLQLIQSGFLLSFGAVAGIACIYPILREGFRKKNGLWDMAALNAGIQLATLPVLLFFYYEIPVYGFFINLLVLPLASLLFPLALLGCLAGSLFLPAGKFLMGGVHTMLLFYEEVCKISRLLPGSIFIAGRPSAEKLFLYFLLLIIALLGFGCWKEKGRRTLFLSLLPVALLVLLFSFPTTFLKVTVLDVGQGDGIVVEAPGGSTFLIDGGSLDVKEVGKYRLIPFLKANGIKKVDYAFVTHADMDHISGLLELLKGGEIPVKNLVLPSGAPMDENYEKLYAAAQEHTKVLRMKKGNQIRSGAVTIRCLHPLEEFTGNSRNSYSLVLSVEWKDFSMLLTGDLEAKEEKQIDDGTLQRYDVLKVAHHGSAYSTANRFLASIRPKISIISCGKDNSFGHPHPELVQRLLKCHSRLYFTKTGGSVTVEANGKHFRTKYFLKSEEEKN